jgi:hypothetical protein
MRIFMKAVTSTVTVGLLAFGAVAGSGGSAFAGPAPVPYVRPGRSLRCRLRRRF